jgi:copper oxidase (laccase) domain-containing protein
MSDLLKIESKKLESGHIKHGFFGRNGGVSFGVFSSLNCSKFVGDDEKNVVANLNIAKRALNASKLITLKQAHGN